MTPLLPQHVHSVVYAVAGNICGVCFGCSRYCLGKDGLIVNAMWSIVSIVGY